MSDITCGCCCHFHPQSEGSCKRCDCFTLTLRWTNPPELQAELDELRNEITKIKRELIDLSEEVFENYE